MKRLGFLWALLLALPAGAAEYELEPYVLETLVPPSPFHGAHGMDFDAEGTL